MNSFLKKRGLNRMDLCYLAALTLIGLGIRVILRVVITDDWLMYWDPWISDLKHGLLKTAVQGGAGTYL